MLMNASTMNQMQKATRAASRRKTSNRSINYPIIKSIINQKNNAYSARQISQPIIPSIIVQNLIVKQFFRIYILFATMYRSPLSRTMLVREMLLKQVVEVVDLSTPLPRKLLNLFSINNSCFVLQCHLVYSSQLLYSTSAFFAPVRL